MNLLPRLRIALAAGLLAGFSASCAERTEPTLSESEHALLGDFIRLTEIRLLARDLPDSAQALLDTLYAQIDTTQVRADLALIWHEPAKGRLFIQTLHDSLKFRGQEPPPETGRVASP